MKSLITMVAALAVATTFALGQETKPVDTKPATGDGGKPGATTETKPAAAPDTKPATTTPAEKPKREPQANFKKRDGNSDGSITLEEFKAGVKDPAKAEQAFKRRDKNADGKITLEEFAPAARKKQN